MNKPKHWWDERIARDAPDEEYGAAAAAWARGWNAAVRAYHAETEESTRKVMEALAPTDTGRLR